MTTKRNLADDLRAAIRGREISAYKLAQQIGVGQTLISRFRRGKKFGSGKRQQNCRAPRANAGTAVHQASGGANEAANRKD